MVVKYTHKFRAWKSSVGNYVSHNIVNVRVLSPEGQPEHEIERQKIKRILYNEGYNVDRVRFEQAEQVWKAELFTTEFYCVAFLTSFLNNHYFELTTVQYLKPGKILAEIKRLNVEEINEQGIQKKSVLLKFSKNLEEMNRKKIKDRMHGNKETVQQKLSRLLNGRG